MEGSISNVLTNDFRIADICSDLSKWNIAVSLTADRISVRDGNIHNQRYYTYSIYISQDVCDVVLKVQLQQKAKLKLSSLETDVKNVNYTLNFLLSTISDEISEMEDGALKVNKTPPGTVILYNYDSSSIYLITPLSLQ